MADKINPKHEAVLLKATAVIRARGHEGDARLADSVAGVLDSMRQQANSSKALASRPAEVDDSLADAKRLDWLQSTNQTFCGNYSNTGFRAIGSSIWHGTLREAIDGAMIEAAPSHTTNKEK